MGGPAFTPGPWKVYRTSNGALLGIGDAKAGGVTDFQGGFWRSGKERMANIHLVAAAPELYAALAELERGGILGSAESNASGNPNWEHVSSRINAARAALALARGETP